MTEYLVPFCGNCPKCKKYIPPTFSKQPNDKCPFCKYILKRKDWQPTFKVKLKGKKYKKILLFRCATLDVEKNVLKNFKDIWDNFPEDILIIISYVWKHGIGKKVNELDIEVIDLC